MYFPTAGIDINPIYPPLVAFAISTFTSMCGVSGGFLLLPYQMSILGYVHPSVNPTNQLYNIIAIPTGIVRFMRERRMVWPLVWMIIIGNLPGVIIGAFIRINLLPDPRHFKVFVGIVLSYIGLRMVLDMIRGNRNTEKARKAEETFRQQILSKKENNAAVQSKGVRVLRFTPKAISYEFYGQTFTFSTIATFFLCFVVGIVGGIYGISGGAIMAPFFVSFLGLPIYTVAGATLMGTCVTSIFGVLFYVLIAPLYPSMSVSPDWMLGLLIGIGGLVGVYCGARMQKYVPATAIKWILAVVIIGTAIKYAFEVFS